MRRVLVVGAGVAGLAAAEEAASSGAKVVLLESTNSFAPNRGMMPFLLSGACSLKDIRSPDRVDLAERSGFRVSFGQNVRSVDTAARSLVALGPGSSSEKLPFDALILATGSSPLPEVARGTSKPGVFPLSDPDDFAGLAGSVQRFSRIALAGSSAALALVTAEQLSSSLRVVLLLEGSALERFSPVIRRRVLDAATERGVEVVEGGLHSVVGVRKVEAVMSPAGLHPCDAVAILPRRSPSLPEVACQRGQSGGALVDRSMRTSADGVYAAGDCAELGVGSGSISLLLQSSAAVMGRTAGRNSAGGRIAEAGVAGSFGFKVFGVEICAAGITAKEGVALGIDAIEVEDEGGGRNSADAKPFAASMVFERKSQRVYGIQLAGEGSLDLSSYISTIVASRASLEEVASQEAAYNPLADDKALPIRLTAGRIMKRVR